MYLPGTGNDRGDGLFPSTLIVKSDGLLLPPPVLSTRFVTIIFPVVIGGGTGLLNTLFIVQVLSWPGFIVIQLLYRKSYQEMIVGMDYFHQH